MQAIAVALHQPGGGAPPSCTAGLDAQCPAERVRKVSSRLNSSFLENSPKTYMRKGMLITYFD